MIQRAPTVLDVAAAAGVGASTVSRCLHGGRNVSPLVYKRVLEAAKRLGYVPNAVARSLRSQRTHTIGVVFPQITNAFFSRSVQEIESAATAQGWSVVLLTHQECSKNQSTQLANLYRLRTDGVILTPAPDSNLEQVRRELAGRPVVALDRPLWKGADTVTLENRKASAAATRHLIEHGYRRIACVTANPGIYTFQRRIQGYQQAMRSAGLPGELILAADYSALRPAIHQALDRKRFPEALLSLSNMATFVVVEELQSARNRRERQTALIGFDDFDFATLLEPPISVVQQPTKALAIESIRLLLRRIGEPANQPTRTEMVHFPGELVLRRSCGCEEPGRLAE